MSENMHTVSGLTRRVRDCLTNEVGEVWVSGEVSNCRPAASEHIYFTIKDEVAQLSCVLFRGDANKASCLPENGLEVELFGAIDVYAARGQYQLIVREVQAKGAGALQARFEQLKRKLAEEGLFDESRKVAIPRFPSCVAVITSGTGAALQDVLQVLERRAPWVEVKVFPVLVQGAGAAEEVANALDWVNAAVDKDVLDVDTVIVGRGGGSLEDLWAFNEEVVAMSISRSALPVISAVGHEIDFTIADFVSDLRAPTPSAAAELAVPDGTELRQKLDSFERVLERECSDKVEGLQGWMEQVAILRLREGMSRSVREYQQRLDACERVIDGGAEGYVARQRERLSSLEQSLLRHHPERLMGREGERLHSLGLQLKAGMKRVLEESQSGVLSREEVLESLGPNRVLDRGFALVKRKDGKYVTSKDEVKEGDVMVTRLRDGEFESEVL